MDRKFDGPYQTGCRKEQADRYVPRTFLAPPKPSTRYLTSCVVDNELAFLLAIEGKLPNVKSLDFDICRTKRMEGVTSTLDCTYRNLSG